MIIKKEDMSLSKKQIGFETTIYENEVVRLSKTVTISDASDRYDIEDVL